MFDLDASKIVIVGVAALIFIPPKDLPRVMRQVGQFVGKMRRMANEFQGQFMDAMREADMADLRKEAQKLSDAARIDAGLNSVHDLDHHMRPLPSSGAATGAATALAADGEGRAPPPPPPAIPLVLGDHGAAADAAKGETPGDATRTSSEPVASSGSAREPQHTT